MKRIGDISIKLHDAISEFGFKCGKHDSDWNNLLSIITRCKIGGPSDHSDGVCTCKLSNKNVYTERVHCPPHIFC